MKETTILKIALICSLIGLVVLFLLSNTLSVKEYSPQQLNRNEGDNVKLTGTVGKITDSGNLVLIEVNQHNPITIVLFKDNKNYNGINLMSGNYVEILGEVREYRGKSEIVADKIRVIG